MATSPIDWSYHRNGCNTCVKTQQYLSTNRITPAVQVIANKQAIEREAALALARQADRIVATKGKAVRQLELSANPTDEEIAALVIGPSGKLRAPTLRLGRTLLVGFDEATYTQLLGKK